MKLPGRIERVEIVASREVSPGDPESYLTLHHLMVVNHYTDGTKSAPYRYDAVLRKALDAVVIILTASLDGRESVCLRTCIRQPLALRGSLPLPVPDRRSFFALLELPAGLIETSDRGKGGVLRRAEIESLEETGYVMPASRFSFLGNAPFLSPGALPERIHFVRAEVEDVSQRRIPTGDGSPTEEGVDIMWIPVDDAFKMCEQGEIVDMKTELGLRRLFAVEK